MQGRQAQVARLNHAHSFQSLSSRVKYGNSKYTDYNAHADMTSPRRPTLHTDCFTRAVLVLAALVATARVQAGDMCPSPPHYVPRSPAEIAADDHLIHIDSDGGTVGDDGNAELTGRVSVTQDARRVTADQVTYAQDTGRITVAGAVDFEDPLVRIESETGS